MDECRWLRKRCVVEEGALVDLLLVDGNPLEDLFALIVKDGRVVKQIE